RLFPSHRVGVSSTLRQHPHISVQSGFILTLRFCPKVKLLVVWGQFLEIRVVVHSHENWSSFVRLSGWRWGRNESTCNMNERVVSKDQPRRFVWILCCVHQHYH